MDKELIATASQSAERDPRRAPYGFYAGGSFALDHVRVFSWFETLGDLADFLLKIEPQIYGIEGDELVEYRHKVQPLAQRLKFQGFSPALLEEFNHVVKDEFVIDWWGRFDELAAAKTEFAQQLVAWFLDEEEDARPLADDELEDFVEFLKTCGS